MAKKNLVKKNSGKKKFKSEKKFGQNIFWLGKEGEFWSKTNFGQKIVFGHKKTLVRKQLW